MAVYELVSPLEPMDGDQERFARDLADDLQGTRVDVIQLLVEDEYYLAKEVPVDA